MAASRTIGNYLIHKLHKAGIQHIFGIPGDYVLGFFDLMTKDDRVDIINTCDEQGAGFAADAYARINGLGAVCVTYGVGGLKIANTTAQAFAEKSPVVIISGAPGVKERQNDLLLHHKVRDFETQKKVFETFTVYATILDNPDTALAEIDHAIHAALQHKRPVYIELPRDMVFQNGKAHHQAAQLTSTSDPDALQEALTEAVSLMNNSKQPVILAGVEMHRFGLQQELVRLAEKTGIPVASTILAKSVIADNLPFALGIYEGATGIAEIRDYVEASDCLIFLGTFLTDLNLGVYTAKIDPNQNIYATSEKVSILHHRYDGILFADFIRGLLDAELKKRTFKHPHPPAPKPFLPKKNTALTVERLFQALNSFITSEHMVISDVGDALFGANDLYMEHQTEFLSPAYYASLGFAVPAAIGSHYAQPDKRPVVIIGDGAFQMTGLELSTVARYGLNPIIIILNNDGYSTERPMLDGPFNDIHPWQYSKLPLLLNSGIGRRVANEADLSAVLDEAETDKSNFYIIDVVVNRDDRSPALARLTSHLGKAVK